MAQRLVVQSKVRLVAQLRVQVQGKQMLSLQMSSVLSHLVRREIRTGFGWAKATLVDVQEALCKEIMEGN